MAPPNPNPTKKLLGEGKVFLQGNRPIPYHIDTKAADGRWLTITQGTKNISIKGFHIAQVEEGIVAKEGANSHLLLSDLHFENTWQNIIIVGHPQCIRLSSCPFGPEKITHDIEIKNVSGLRYSNKVAWDDR